MSEEQKFNASRFTLTFRLLVTPFWWFLSLANPLASTSLIAAIARARGFRPADPEAGDMTMRRETANAWRLVNEADQHSSWLVDAFEAARSDSAARIRWRTRLWWDVIPRLIAADMAMSEEGKP